jgi:hypothetical protein
VCKRQSHILKEKKIWIASASCDPEGVHGGGEGGGDQQSADEQWEESHCGDDRRRGEQTGEGEQEIGIISRGREEDDD